MIILRKVKNFIDNNWWIKYAVLIIITTPCLIYRYIQYRNSFNIDRTWEYVMAYNIYKGAMLYKDINVASMPLFYYLTAALCHINSSYEFYITSAIFSTIITAVFIYNISRRFKISRFKSCMASIVTIIIFPVSNGYNSKISKVNATPEYNS